MIRSCVLALLLGVPFLMGADSPLRNHGISCHESEGNIVIDFGSTRHPTYVGVQTPRDQFIYLRYPPRGIDVLGDEYRRDTLKLDTSTLRGMKIDGESVTQVKVFDAPGKYTLRFQDANRAEHEDLFALSCTVILSSEKRTTVSPAGS
ncbi:hypothetical protein ACFOLC_07355 [Lysobacter cavernae]|uniref:Uncharacterized protein n=1 Tax=Lysobacter cavernae TaxID=1685901 RepID=A0ABV7RNV6_9GAMM